MQESYEWLKNIRSLNFENKSILIIGGGNIAKKYVLALSKMKIKDVTVISKSKESAARLSDEFHIRSLAGGFEENLLNMKKVDLVIVATPIPLLIPATKLALECGQNNILVEKPGSLYYQELQSLAQKTNSQKIRIAYNRLVYPNFHKLKSLVKKEGGISSCKFTFTEQIHTIKFKNEYSEVYDRWGISNSLHVISMAIDLIGMPKEISAFRSGKLEWHKSGSIFVGSGITEINIPFSYHADWNSAGRWGIEVMTKENAYRLIPLEELYVYHKGSYEWEPVSFDIPFSDVKQGIAEEIALMLDNKTESEIGLVSLERAAQFNKLAEKIFGYDSNNN